MNNVIINPAAEKQNDNKWIPCGLIIFPKNGSQVERAENYSNKKFDTKEEANQFFLQASKKRYKIDI